MTIRFTATEVKALDLDDFYILAFADSKTDPAEYVSIQLAKEFNAQDIALSQDGEYFEYGDEDDMAAAYKCVGGAMLTAEALTFSLHPPLAESIEAVKIHLETPLDEAALDYLRMMFAGRLTIERENQQPEYIDKVITIHDYYDGLRLGVATLNGAPCIYESKFYDSGDSSEEMFFLTPIEPDVFDMVLKDWGRWIAWMETHHSAQGWNEHNQFDLRDIAKQSQHYRQFIRRGTFHGDYKNFHSRIDTLSVVWSE